VPKPKDWTQLRTEWPNSGSCGKQADGILSVNREKHLAQLDLLATSDYL
jgi:hypothetical protein